MKKIIIFLLITFIGLVGCLSVNPAYAEVIQDCIYPKPEPPFEASDDVKSRYAETQYEVCKSALIKMDQYFPNRDWKTVRYKGQRSPQLNQAYRYVVYIIANIFSANVDMAHYKFKKGWDSEGAIKILKEGKAFLMPYSLFNSFAIDGLNLNIKNLSG